MCEFLEFDGADYRHAPTNAGPDDLLALWKRKAQGPGRRAEVTELHVFAHGRLPGAVGAFVRPVASPQLSEFCRRLTSIRPEDVVILPAFGVTVDDFARLQRIGCTLVDTTCGSVLNVWKRVESYARDGFTAIIHGKHWHEETKATASQVMKYPQGRYLVVFDMHEARMVHPEAPETLTTQDLGAASVTSSEVADQSLTAADLGPNSVAASEQVKMQGKPNDLIRRLKHEAAFSKLDLTQVVDPAHFTGRASEQTKQFVEHQVGPVRSRYASSLGQRVELKV